MAKVLANFAKKIDWERNVNWGNLKETLENVTEEILLKGIAHSPYDGCWYEPNFWHLRQVGEEGDWWVVPLYASTPRWNFGPMGQEAELSVEKDSETLIDFFESGRVDEWECTPIFEDTVLNLLIHPVFLERVQQHWPEDATEPLLKCSCCDQEFWGPVFVHGQDYYGCGGVASATSKIYCYECISDSCQHCGYPFYPDARRIEEGDCSSCKECAATKKCGRCGQDTILEDLKHGFCESCVDEILQKVAANAVGREIEEILAPLCEKCGRGVGDSRHPQWCQDCSDLDIYGKRLRG